MGAGQHAAVRVVMGPQADGVVTVRNQALRADIATGARAGIAIGSLSGLACGPLMVLCVPLGAPRSLLIDRARRHWVLSDELSNARIIVEWQDMLLSFTFELTDTFWCDGIYPRMKWRSE